METKYNLTQLKIIKILIIILNKILLTLLTTIKCIKIDIKHNKTIWYKLAQSRFY